MLPGFHLGARSHPARLLVVVALVAAGCTFEQRPDRAAENDEDEDGVPVVSAEDSVQAVREAFLEAMEAGDLAGALSLVDRDAVVVDPFSETPRHEASLGEVFLEVLGAYGTEIRMSPTGSQVTVLGDHAVAVTDYELQWWGEEEWERAGSLVETLVLARGEEGWRIHHLHRSVPGSVGEERRGGPR